MTDPVSHADFAPHVGKRFAFAGWHATLVLARIDTLPRSAHPGASRTPFILVFSGPPDELLPEGHYTATTEDLPATPLHIMPIHTLARDRQDYQVVFN